jgi:HK97 family phage portal protein
LGWIGDNLPQARLRVTRNPDADEPSEVKNHPLTKLIRRPNGYYSGKALWAATAISYCVSGDAYWIKARGTGGFGSPVELWYVPHWQILPQYESDGSSFISSYLYRPGSGKEYTLQRKDLVHFRFGIDPENPRLGWSRLKSVLREMLSDNEIATYTAAILRNLGMPGGIVSPGEPGAVLPPDEQDRLEATWASKFTKSNRGRVLVASRKLQVDFPAFSPEQLVIDKMGNRPEARVCGALRIPPMVVGLNVGDAQRTYSNWAEARSAAWEDCIIPMQSDFAETLDSDLLGDLGDSDREDVDWDYSKVRALAEDEDAKSKRAVSQFSAGGITRATFLTMVGQKPAPGNEDEVFFVPKGGSLVHRDDAGAAAVQQQAALRQQQQQAALDGLQESQGDAGAAALPASNGNGNGNGKRPVGAGQ